MTYLLALLIGVVAGLRAITAPAAIAWAVGLGWIDLSGSWLSPFGRTWLRWLLTALALGELVSDQLPSTPPRTVPIQFGTRLVMGAVCGAAIGATGGAVPGGLIAGAVGAAIGTIGGRRGRAALARRLGRDRPAALLEDAIAIGLAVLVGLAAR